MDEHHSATPRLFHRATRRFAVITLAVVVSGTLGLLHFDPFAPLPVRQGWNHAEREESSLGILDASFPVWGPAYGVQVSVYDRRLRLLKECNFDQRPVKHLVLATDGADIHLFVRNDHDPEWARLERNGTYRGLRWIYLNPHSTLQLLILADISLDERAVTRSVSEVLRLSLEDGVVRTGL